MTHPSCHCKQNAKLIKLDFHHLRALEICDPRRWVSFHTPTWRKKTGSSWFFNVLAWKKKQRSRSRFWRRRMRQTQGETTKSSSPRKWLGVFETINWRGSPNFHKDDTFLLFAGSTTAYQNVRQCSGGEMSHSFLCSCRNFYRKSHGTWIMRTVSFFFSACAWLSYAFKTGAVCFPSDHWKKSFEAFQDEKTGKKKADFISVALCWKITPICIRTKAALPYIKAIKWLVCLWVSVREKPHCSQAETKARLPVKPAASSHHSH